MEESLGRRVIHLKPAFRSIKRKAVSVRAASISTPLSLSPCPPPRHLKVHFLPTPTVKDISRDLDQLTEDLNSLQNRGKSVEIRLKFEEIERKYRKYEDEIPVLEMKKSTKPRKRMFSSEKVEEEMSKKPEILYKSRFETVQVVKTSKPLRNRGIHREGFWGRRRGREVAL